ncbi:hypothetical protein [Pontibacter ruber]|uniref:DUF3592 domain-containing protein n=1 Tax=Pontibacter ruber TaxID=1343895 RepID=A0ABW5CYR8_9BACT|nr:hypothetical protein [Pontibacter ruber]
MKEEPEIISEKYLSIFIILVIGGLGSSAIAFYLINASLSDDYPQIWGLVLGALFGLFGLYGLIAVFLIDNLEVYRDRLVLKSITGKTKKVIYLSEIVTWTEIEKENKHQKWKDLTIYTVSNKYKISSSLYSNYSEIRNRLIKGKPRDLEIEKIWHKRNNLYWAIGAFIMGGLCFWSAYHFYADKDSTLSSDSLTTITGEITSPVEISSGAKSSRYIQIELKEYPGFSFDINGVAYAATDADEFVSRVKVGDRVSLSIPTDQYRKKLTKEEELGFWDKTVNYSFIQVYGLQDNHQSYLSTYAYGEEKKDDDKVGIWAFSLLCVFFSGIGIYVLLTSQK